MAENLDNDKLWINILEDIKQNINQATFYTLFKDTSLVEISNNRALVSAPSAMVIDLLQKKCSKEIIQSIKNVTGKNYLIEFTSRQVITKTEPTGPLFAQESSSKPTVGHLPRVRPDYTFENFAVSSSNQLAYVSANTVAENIGTSYNPFFIYGPVGVGKTHLMHAIANKAYYSKPNFKILYITSEEFTNEVVEAIRLNNTANMKRRFRGANLLLIDDIQFIEGKERVQEELFHTFNYLTDSGSQICLSSDRPPRDIKKLESRLSSRFAGGLIVDVSAPDLELKTAILGIKAEKYNVTIPTEVAMYLAEQVQDTRSLEGLLLRVITLATTTTQDIDLRLAKQAVGDDLMDKKSRLHSEDIIDAVCTFYSIKPTQLKGPKRDASLVRARQVCMYLLKSELGLTYVEIGNLLGGRDHTTIMHGVEKIESLVEKKAVVFQDISGITKNLRE